MALNVGGGLNERWIREKITVFNGFIDPHQVLKNDSAAAQGHVADFAVAGFAECHADGRPGCLQQHGWIVVDDLVERRRLGAQDRITGAGGRMAPSVQNCKNDWFHPFSISEIYKIRIICYTMNLFL